MQVEMRDRMTDEQRRQAIKDFLAHSEQVLEDNRELQRYVDRTLDEALRGIRRASAQLRRELRRASYY
jgi:hypothetical protein